jgi:transcriptional regulator with XRE-family HTH domain
LVQETTKEFAARLGLAIEAYPLAPPTPHGRLTWLQRQLEQQGTKVSINTVHKWVHGLSRPREDKVRAIAQFLKVDEVWLTLGQKPVEGQRPTPNKTTHAKGAVLYVAGLIEVTGGRVVFPGPDDNTATSIWADLGEGNIGIVVVMPQSEENGTLSFVVPEPVGHDRVFAVVPSKDLLPTIHDITRAVRQSFGGFSVVAFETEKGIKNDFLPPAMLSFAEVMEAN